MRRITLVMLILVILSTSSSAISVKAQDSGTTLVPNFEIQGILTKEDSLNTFHVDFRYPGMYKISLQDPDDSVGISLRVYSGGLAQTVEALHGSDSVLVPITKNGINGLQRHYQLAIYVLGIINSDEIREYTVSIMQLGGEKIILPNESIDFYMSSGDGYMFSFDSRNYDYSHYEMMIDNNGPFEIIWELYSDDSLLLAEGITYNARNYSIVLEPGLYHIFIENSYDDTFMTTFRFMPTSFHNLSPESEVSLSIEEGKSRNIIIPLEYAKSGKIDIHYNGDFSGYVNLYLGASTSCERMMSATIGGHDWINISDLVVIPSNAWAYVYSSAIDRNFSLEARDYSTSLHHNYNLFLKCHSQQGNGEIKIRYHTLEDVDTLTPNLQQSVYFVEGDSRAFAILRVSNLDAMKVYSLVINQTDQDDSHSIVTNPEVYIRNDWDQGYLYRQRPWLTKSAREEMDKKYSRTWTYFNQIIEADSVLTETIYQRNNEDYWIYLALEKFPYDPNLSPFNMSGIVTLKLVEHPSYHILPGEYIKFLSASDLSDYVFRSTFLEGHTYRISISYPTYSAYSGFSIFNSSGYLLPTTNDDYFREIDIHNDNLLQGIYFSHITQDIAALISIYGDGEVVFTIEDITGGVNLPYVAIGLISAIFIGIGIGIYITKRGIV